MALEALGDDVGVARARYLMCELAWLQGASERGLREAREALRFARRAGGTVELDAGVSVIAWALVVNRVPVPAARAECDELLRSVAGRRFAELGVRGFVAVLDAMAGDFGRARDAARPVARRAATTSGCTRPRSGWRCSTPRPSCWPATRPPPRPRWTTPSASPARSAIAGSSRRSCVDRAHVLLAQDRLARGRRRRSPRIEEVPAPNDLEWRIKRLAARGKLAAREGRAEQALAEARAAVALADATELFLFRADAWRDLAEVAAARGRGRGGRGRARDGARRSIAPRATSPPRASSRASAAAARLAEPVDSWRAAGA